MSRVCADYPRFCSDCFCLFFLKCELITYKFHNSKLQCDCFYCQDIESSAVCAVKNDAVSAEVDETQSHVWPVVVLKTLNLAR